MWLGLNSRRHVKGDCCTRERAGLEYPLRLGKKKKGRANTHKDTTYVKDELSLGGALLQDGVDHVVLLLFGHAGRRRGRDVERHA